MKGEFKLYGSLPLFKKQQGLYFGCKTLWHFSLVMKCVLLLLPGTQHFLYKSIIWVAAHGSSVLVWSFLFFLSPLLLLLSPQPWSVGGAQEALALMPPAFKWKPIDWGCVFISFAWYLTRKERWEVRGLAGRQTHSMEVCLALLTLWDPSGPSSHTHTNSQRGQEG